MKRFVPTRPVLALLLAGAALTVAGPVVASQVDSWGGGVFLHHETDVLAYPHRALEFPGSATIVYVPPTSSASDFHRAPADRQDVAGVLTFGGDSWSGIIGANAPNAFNPVRAYGSGSSRGWGRSLIRGDLDYTSLVLGINSLSYHPQPNARMQLGAAYRIDDDASVGLSFQQFGQEWTMDSVLGTNPSEKVGFDINGFNVTGSGEIQLPGDLPGVEAAFSYGTSDQEEFSPIDGAGGKGDASTYSVAATVDLGDLEWVATRHVFDYLFYGRYDNTNSSFTGDAITGSTDPAPLWDRDYSGFDFRAGVAHTNEQKFATSIGINGYTDESSTRTVGSAVSKTKVLSVPSCDASGEVPITDHIALDWGAMAAWQDVEITDTIRDGAGVLTSRSKEVDTSLATSYHLGLVWRPVEDLRVSLTVDTDQIGDPGGVVFGNSNDAPGIAIGASYRFQ